MMEYIKKSLLGYLPFISICIGIFLYSGVFANTASMDPNFYTNTPIGFNNPLNTMSIQNDGRILLGGGFTAYK